MKWYMAWAQTADRRQHAERVAGQEDDVGRVAGDAGDASVANELDRVGAAGVLRDARVGEIDGPVVPQGHVLQDGAEPECGEDVRLVLGREVDRLGVEAALAVAYAVVAAAVVVV